ncbi:MAG: holo-ACP synthase [Gammaproteobacteria bacterium]|nr:holo-ACP synthase [Gammaproteobacteria bacterium]
MIVGIGVDIAEIARVRELAGKFGQRFARRILTDQELIEFDLRRQSSSYLATRFAAKEAVAKALGTGIGKQFGFHSVQVDHDQQGRPLLRFLDDAAELVAALKIKNALISLSDEKHYVVAMVVLES